jgi:signal transduction histidine kinase
VAEDGVARVTVRDHGEGLDPRDTARVFEPFWRGGEAVSGAIRGTGIGLSLVREYVRSMGGDVGVESVAGRGATFWFTLPLAASGNGASH